jgi:bacteriocin biosynthesis cyclodehydratase domain-containing protein
MRPVLAPGLRVLRRSREELQIGLGPDRRLTLADTEPVRRTLGHLLRGEAVPGDPASRDALEMLAPVLVDGAGLVASDVAAGDVAAAALRDPSGYAARLAGRRTAEISVVGTLEATPADPRPLLAAAGLRVVEPHARPARTPTAVLVLALGEVDRSELDPLLRERRPHLVVRLVEGSALVGPFVEPGRTACLRCIDAHRAIDDPQAATMAALHALARDDRRDGVAEPVDTALAALAVAWAVRDLVTHVDGERPSTWSATVNLAAGLESVTQTEWLRHPACGCTWLPDAQVSITMAV